MDIKRIRPLRNDVLIKKALVEQEGMIIVRDNRENELNTFEVVAVGPTSIHVNPGDTVWIKFMEHTPPFEADGVQYSVVNENDIWMVGENV